MAAKALVIERIYPCLIEVWRCICNWSRMRYEELLVAEKNFRQQPQARTMRMCFQSFVARVHDFSSLLLTLTRLGSLVEVHGINRCSAILRVVTNAIPVGSTRYVELALTLTSEAKRLMVSSVSPLTTASRVVSTSPRWNKHSRATTAVEIRAWAKQRHLTGTTKIRPWIKQIRPWMP